MGQIIPNRVTYNLQITNGVATLRYPFGNHINDPKILQHLAHSLIHTSRILQAGQLDSDALRYQSACQGADAIQFNKQANWYFGDDIEHALRDVSKGYVYFAQNSTNFPSVLKVGASSSPADRMKSLATFHKVPIGSFEVIALCQTKDYEDLEYYLKIQFEKHRRMGEFFDEQAVRWYLTFVQQYLDNSKHMTETNVVYNWSEPESK